MLAYFLADRLNGAAAEAKREERKERVACAIVTYFCLGNILKRGACGEFV